LAERRIAASAQTRAAGGGESTTRAEPAGTGGPFRSVTGAGVVQTRLMPTLGVDEPARKPDRQYP
jgi:hypothetical protein